MAKKKQYIPNFYEIYERVRRGWDGVNPVTKVIENKKTYNRKSKHKNKFFESENDKNGDSSSF